MTRSPVVVALGIFVVAWGANVSTPFLATYRDRLGLGDNATQLIFVVYVTGILSVLPISGQLSDRIGRRRVMVPSLLISAVASAVLILGRDSYGALMVGRIGLGVASGAALGVGAAWLLELLGPGRELRAALIATVVTYGGFGFGPPISTVWEQWGPSPLVWPFVVHIGATLAMVPFLLRARETVIATKPGRRPWLRIDLGVPQEARIEFWLVLAPLAVLVFAFPATGFSLFPLLAADDFGGSPVVLTGVAAVATPWGGLLARPYLAKVAPDAALLHGALIGTVGYVLGTVAWAAGWWPLVWPSSVALGAASGIIASAGLAAVGRMAHEQHRGALSSTFYVLAYAGMAMPLAITGVAGLIGMAATLTLVCSLAAAIAVTTPTRRRVAASAASAVL